MNSVAQRIHAYELEPFEQVLIPRRDEILDFFQVSQAAFNALNGLARLSEKLGYDQETVERNRIVETKAMNSAKSDFPMLNNSVSVLIWSSLEATINDFLVRWIYANRDARTVKPLEKVQISAGTYESMNEIERMTLLIQELERNLKSQEKTGVGRFNTLLDVFNLKPKINNQVKKDLVELGSIRNIIVHKSNIVDKKMAENCPWLDLQVGEVFNVTSVRVLSYLNAVGEYAVAVIEAVERKHDNEKPQET